MSALIQLAWCDFSWNPIAGCLPNSPGCRNCYAAKLAGTQQAAHKVALYKGTTKRMKDGRYVFDGKVTTLPPEHPAWLFPLNWKGAKNPVMGPGKPSLLWVGSMTDVFFERRPREHVDRVVSILGACPHVVQFLTRREERMRDYFLHGRHSPRTLDRWKRRFWLGISASDQKEFDRRWPAMRDLAGAGWTIWVHIAPMLGPVILPDDLLALGDRAWVGCSGEQGKGKRRMAPEWARAVLAQCKAGGVPFFQLQMTGRDPIPPDLFVREFPRLLEDGPATPAADLDAA